MNNDHNKNENISIAELNNYSPKRANFTLNSSNSKPFDVNKMTGKPTDNQSSSKEGEK